ncbi:hypothetical protein AA0113_g7318 [Alternaria arborescens]|uniref:Protein kinase domain-containing protein n=1 Tax=Alternaria arborescens TaxID=156630 RepID=A0A4Q4RRU6_9PLEO|nr:hypothetical protein AA0112_g8088 [Alternaria arborescens]RYO59827.1 hypothetical protein AA0113_g7318 [Alternaria arborescens]
MTAHDVEDLQESADHAMDTIEVEQTNTLPWMPVGDLDEFYIDGLHIDEPDINDFSSEPPWSAYQPFTGLEFRRAKTGTLDDHDALSSSPGYQQSSMSDFNSSATFVTASSLATFTSARSTYSGPAMRIETIREDEPPEPGLSATLIWLHEDYYSSLHKKNIIRPFDEELNWSGKGQHVTFSATDPIPLSHISHLGSSNSANVDKVLCRRVALARKTMRCDRRWTVADALQEVYHLQNLRHYHIVQLVGTYLQGRNFSILMYPAADMHLGTFLEDTLDMSMEDSVRRRSFLTLALGCLTSAVAFIHQRTTKHMDIKPRNILVRQANLDDSEPKWRVYIADFGLSRTFASHDHSQTDGPTFRTPRYCAPEVFHYERRGRSADIFSLGCVFLEMLTAICYIDLQVFINARRGDDGDESFHANLKRVVEWARGNLYAPSSDFEFRGDKVIADHELEMATELVISMVAQEPEKRPTAVGVLSHLLMNGPPSPFLPMLCCRSPPELYEAYEPPC